MLLCFDQSILKTDLLPSSSYFKNNNRQTFGSTATPLKTQTHSQMHVLRRLPSFAPSSGCKHGGLEQTECDPLVMQLIFSPRDMNEDSWKYEWIMEAWISRCHRAFLCHRLFDFLLHLPFHDACTSIYFLLLGSFSSPSFLSHETASLDCSWEGRYRNYPLKFES